MAIALETNRFANSKLAVMTSPRHTGFLPLKGTLKGGGEEGVGPASTESQNLAHRISQTLIREANPAYPRSGADPLLSSPFQGYRIHTSPNCKQTQ